MNATLQSLRIISYAMILYGSFAVWALLGSDGAIAMVLLELTDDFVRSGVWSLGVGLGLGVLLQLKAQRSRIFHWIILVIALIPFVKGVRLIHGWDTQARAAADKEKHIVDRTREISGVPISGALSTHYACVMVPVQSGGFIVAWIDDKKEARVQRVDASAEVPWGIDGLGMQRTLSIPITSDDLQAVSDAAGGVIIGWEEEDSIAVQRVNQIGRTLWGTNGNRLFRRSDFKIACDKNGEMAAIYRQRSSSADNAASAVCIQCLDPQGAAVWPEGIRIGTTENPSGDLYVAADDAALTTTYGSHAQKIDRLGKVLWAPDGVKAWASSRVFQSSHGDGAGGVVVVGETRDSLFVQRIGSSGTPLWGPHGILVTVASWQVDCTSDGHQGTIVWWPNSPFGYYAQRVDSSGTFQWAEGGIPICPGSYLLQAVGDGAGGLIVVSYFGSNVVAQRFDAAGKPVWGDTGIRAKGEEMRVLPADSGGCYLVWRDTTSNRLLAQNVDAQGSPTWAVPPSD